MQVTTKELRIQPGKIIEHVLHGAEITVTYRGKSMARIVPISNHQNQDPHEADTIFGMWKDREEKRSVEASIREMRNGRTF